MSRSSEPSVRPSAEDVCTEKVDALTAVQAEIRELRQGAEPSNVMSVEEAHTIFAELADNEARARALELTIPWLRHELLAAQIEVNSAEAAVQRARMAVLEPQIPVLQSNIEAARRKFDAVQRELFQVTNAAGSAEMRERKQRFELIALDEQYGFVSDAASR